MDVGSGPEGSKIVDLVSKGGEHLVGASPSAVGEEKGAVSGIDMVFFLEIMAS